MSVIYHTSVHTVYTIIKLSKQSQTFGLRICLPGCLPGAAAPVVQNSSELMRPLGQADRLVHEEAHPILPQLVEPVLESVDCTRVYDVLW